MQVRVVLVCALVVVSGCGKKSNCDKWLAMQQKCEGDRVGDKDHDIEMCKGIETGDGSDALYYKRTHDCAAETDDCAAYGKCFDAATAEHVKAPAAQAAQATELTLEIIRVSMAAINGVSDCDPQTTKLTAALQPLTTKSTELKGLVKDEAVFEAVRRSHRIRDAVAALKKASACDPVRDVAQKAITIPFMAF